MLTPKQLEERLNYLGASEAASVLGLSRWATLLEIWGYKTGNLAPKDLSDHLPVILGNRLEEVVAELFTAKTGKKVRRVNETFYHPKYNFLACNIDRRVVGEDTLLEAKTASSWKSKEWAGEDAPQEYLIQVQQMLSVTGYKKAYLAVLIGNTEFIVKEIERDEGLIKQMTPKLVSFWQDYVVPKVMPMQITSSDSDTLFSLFPNETDTELVFGDDIDQLIQSRAAMITEIKDIEKWVLKIENEIKARMQNAATALTNLNKITWKVQKTNRLDIKTLEAEMPEVYAKYLKETTSRVLRIRPLKEIL